MQQCTQAQVEKEGHALDQAGFQRWLGANQGVEDMADQQGGDRQLAQVEQDPVRTTGSVRTDRSQRTVQNRKHHRDFRRIEQNSGKNEDVADGDGQGVVLAGNEGKADGEDAGHHRRQGQEQPGNVSREGLIGGVGEDPRPDQDDRREDCPCFRTNRLVVERHDQVESLLSDVRHGCYSNPGVKASTTKSRPDENC